MKAVFVGFLLMFGLSSSSEAQAQEDSPSMSSKDEREDAAGDVQSASAADRLTEWEAPPSCIGLPDLRERLRTQMMGEPSVIREVRGNMLRGPAGWIASFTVYDGDRRLGERVLELSPEDCRTHDETLALVVALLLEHGPPSPEGEAPSDPPKAETESAERSEEKQEPKEPPPGARLPAEEAAPVLPLRGGLGFQALSGWLPSVAFGPRVFVGAEVFEQASVELVGDYYLPKEAAGIEQATARTSGGRVHVRGCSLPDFGKWSASGCFGLGWIAVAASGQGVLEAKTALHGTFEISASSGLIYRWNPHFGLEVGAEFTAPLRRGRFVFENDSALEEVHSTSRLLFASYVGVVLTL